MAKRMSGAERRAQILEIAAEEFATHGLHGASTEAIARSAGITQAYVFRIFGSKKALFLELVSEAFDRVTTGMQAVASEASGLSALSAMGREYYELLADRNHLLLQLQGFAACGDNDVRHAVREAFGRMWRTVSASTGLEPVTVKTFLAFGMLLNSGAAIDIDEIDEDWAQGIQTHIEPGLFSHITTENNQ